MFNENFNQNSKDKSFFKSNFNISRGELDKIFESEKFSPDDLMGLLNIDYSDIYQEDAGVWEGYSLGEHTLMVMKQFEKYFKNKDIPLNFDRNIFRLFLALHDIGKPEAINNGGKHFQYEYSQKYIQEIFRHLEIKEDDLNLSLALVSGDPIGKYLTSKIDEDEAKNTIRLTAEKINVSPQDFFNLLLIYYKVDAGSYTKDAGGLESLDSLFDFDKENGILNFATHVQEKIDLLKF